MSTEQAVEFKPAAPVVADPAKDNKSFVEVEPVEEAAPEETAPVAAPAAAPVADIPPPPPAPKPEGWDQIDFGKIQDPELRSAVEARINRLYGQVKQSERQWAQVREYQQRLEQQLEEVKSGQQQVVASTEEQEINTLKTKFVEEYNKGNHEEVIKILGAINEKDLARREKLKNQPAPETKPEQPGVGQPGGFNIPEPAKLAMRQWAADKPYAQRNSPLYQQTIHVMNHYLQEGAKAGKDLNWLLSTTDAYMRAELAKQQPQNKPGTPAIVNQVLGNQQGVTRNENKGPDLSEEEKMVARKLFNKLKPADAYKKYSSGKKI